MGKSGNFYLSEILFSKSNQTLKIFIYVFLNSYIFYQIQPLLKYEFSDAIYYNEANCFFSFKFVS